MKNDKGTIKVTVRDQVPGRTPIGGATVRIYPVLTDENYKSKTGRKAASAIPSEAPFATKTTDQNGQAEFDLKPQSYQVFVDSFVEVEPKTTDVTECGCSNLIFEIPVRFEVKAVVCRDDATSRACPDVTIAGTPVQFNATTAAAEFRVPVEFKFASTGGTLTKTGDQTAILETGGLRNPATVSATLLESGTGTAGQSLSQMTVSEEMNFTPPASQPVSGDLSVTLRRSGTSLTPDLPLWTVIRSATTAISFNSYKNFMDEVMCGGLSRRAVEAEYQNRRPLSLPFPGVDGYSAVKSATEVFLMEHCGVLVDFTKLDLTGEGGRWGRDVSSHELQEFWDAYLVEVNGGSHVKTLPYLALIRSRLGEVPLKNGNGFGGEEVANCFGILQRKLENPCLLELIWSYWHEEGMLVQTMKAIGLRFQNRGNGDRDPMMRFDIDPLRPMANLLWGYIQDEQHRLSIMRRNYEYCHHYGMALQGKAAPPLRAADCRTKFLEAFHNLLYLCSIFFKADDDTTVIADGFPVMNAIREVHLLLAEGAHNQFGDLPSTARQEMLIEMWLLARPEMREFLGGRIMVPYSEVWMDRVDTVKRLQGWTDTTITDFHDLATFGEQLLLSIRYGHWSDVHDPSFAANWARYWRPEIQGYVHSYRAVTGVDLTQDSPEANRPGERYIQPSVHLRRRLNLQLARK